VTTPQDPRRHPLQDDEIALARVLRALPTGEPSPAVDAAILAAATDAVPRRRKAGTGLRWLPTWAVGTAAAAVLAVGIGIQLRPPLVPPPPPAASTSEQLRELPQARPRMAVDLAEPEATPAPPPAPPPSQPQAAPRAVAPAAPANKAPDVLSEVTSQPAEPVSGEEPAAAAFEDLGGFAPPLVLASAPAPAPTPASAAPPAAAPIAEQEPARESDQLDRVEVSGSRIHGPASRNLSGNLSAQIDAAEAAEAIAREEARQEYRARRQSEGEAEAARRQQAKAALAPLPAVSDDATLPPREWLDRIRDRSDRGDRAGARESLALFARTYPRAPIPRDLAHLR